MGYTFKITNILAANCPKVANNILNLSRCITVLPSGKIKELTNLFTININKNFINTRKNVYKLIEVYLQNYSHFSCYKSYTFLSFTQKKLRIMLFDMV